MTWFYGEHGGPENFHEMYRDMLADLVRHGKPVAPRGLPTRELEDVVLVLPPVTDGGMCSGRTNDAYLLAEMAWYTSRDPSVDFIKRHAGLWGKIQNPDGTANSNYGEKIWVTHRPHTPLHSGRGANVAAAPCTCLWVSEWSWARDSILRDNLTRQAVMVIHRPEHHWEGNKDVPCTLTISFAVRDGELRTRAHMRSSDAWFGLPYDVPFFLWLHRRMAYEVGADPGPLRVMLDSFHVYEHRVSHAEAYLAKWRPAPSRVNPVPHTLPLDKAHALATELLAVAGKKEVPA